MNRTLQPSSLTSRILQLAPVSAAIVLLGTACGTSSGSDAAQAPPPSGTGSMQNADPAAPATPAAPAANDNPSNPESLGPPPPLDNDSTAAADTDGVASPAADGGAPSPEPTGDAGPAPSSDPTTDENLVFIQQDGFQTTYFALDCRSIGADGSVIDGATNTALPVGGGRILECSLERFPTRATTDVLSATNEPWCALGELGSYTSGGDDRLVITIATPPDVSPATLIATHEGEEVSVMQASAFGGRLWPLWIDAAYEVVELARAEQGKTCDEVFGL